MTKRKTLNGMPYAGNPHVRFDKGGVASAATPRRRSLLYKKKMKVLIGVLSAIFTGALWAIEVTVEQAERYAEAWFVAKVGKTGDVCRTGLSVRTVRNDEGRVLFHVVCAPEGGFVAIAGDTALRPVIAFSKTDEFVEREGSPLYDLLVLDMSKRIAAIDAAAGSGLSVRRTFAGIEKLPSAAIDVGRDDIRDVRVAPITSAKWTQNTFGAVKGKAFNLYTPANYPCGCVATAYLTVMRHWCEPSGTVTPTSFTCWIDGKRTVLKTYGGTYDWDSMPLVSEECTMDSQLQALGKLAYDVSVAMHTDFSYGASCTWGGLAATALVESFGYASVRMYDNVLAPLYAKNVATDVDYRNAILASLDAGMPVVVGISGKIGYGHQLVIDGYGYDDNGIMFCHLNCGWEGGRQNLWYNVIGDDITEQYRFDSISDVAYNIHPYVAGDVISGRVLDANGSPVSGIEVKLSRSGSPDAKTMTNGKGIYYFRFSGKGTFTLSASDQVLGHASRKVVIASEGRNAEYEFDEDNHQLYVISDQRGKAKAGEIANRWGEDLKLAVDNGGMTDSEPPFNAANAGVFDGVVLSDDRIWGTIQIKAAREKNGESKLTAMVMLIDRPKKLSFKGVLRTATGNATLSCSGEADMTLFLGENILSGEMSNGRLTVSGARSEFSSKNKDEANAAERKLEPHIGTINIYAADARLSVSIAKRGKSKVAGTFCGGKVSASAQAYIRHADGNVCIPVIFTKGKPFAFLLMLGGDGASLSGLDDVIQVGAAGGLKFGSRFQLLEASALSSLVGLCNTLLPWSEPLTVSGGKWGTDKAAKVSYKKGDPDVTVKSAESDGVVKNPSGLKLSYKAKDGSFKGSFKVYALESGKLRKYGASVSGILVNGVGYGMAEIKKVGACQIKIGVP